MEVFCSFPLTVLNLKLQSFTYFTLIYAQVGDRDLISSFYILLSSFIEEVVCLLPLMIFLEYVKIQVTTTSRICFQILYSTLLVYTTVGIVLYVSAAVALQCIDHCGESLSSFHVGLLFLFSIILCFKSLYPTAPYLVFVLFSMFGQNIRNNFGFSFKKINLLRLELCSKIWFILEKLPECAGENTSSMALMGISCKCLLCLLVSTSFNPYLYFSTE